MECPNCLEDPCVCDKDDVMDEEIPEELEDMDMEEGEESDICTNCWKEPCECD